MERVSLWRFQIAYGESILMEVSNSLWREDPSMEVSNSLWREDPYGGFK